MENFDIGLAWWLVCIVSSLFFISTGYEPIAIWVILLYITTKLNEPKR